MRLLVDIGNSRVKSALDTGAELVALQPFAWRDAPLDEMLGVHWLAALERHGQSAAPTGVHVSNVAGDALLPALSDWCDERWGLRAEAVHSVPEFGGLTNGYRDPGSLGVDRWTAMIGARAQAQGALCVVDSGTATTVDVIDAAGRHIGGAILPGIYTMRRSLVKYTAALFAADGEIQPFSDHTAGGIAGGTGYAAAGAIDRMVDEANAAVGDVTTFVTGGDAAVLASLMRHPVRSDPLLVLRGVRCVARGAGSAYTRTGVPV